MELARNSINPAFGIKKSISNGQIYILCIIIYPFLLIWQGLDVTDGGFFMSNYQMIFKYPETVQYSFMYWLTDIIGGIWLYFFGSLGYIGIKIFNIILIWITMYICYIILKDHISKETLLAGLLLVLIFTDNYTRMMEYNRLTGLFYSIAILALVNGLKREKNFLIFISGTIIAVNLFVRIANVVGILFFVLILFYGFITKANLKVQSKNLILHFSGFLSGLFMMLTLMKLIGHDNYFFNSLLITREIGKSEVSTHSFQHLIELLVSDNIKVFSSLAKTGVAIVLLLILNITLTRFRVNIYKYRVLIFLLTIPPLLYHFYKSYSPSVYDYIDVIIVLTGLFYTAAVLYIVNPFKTDNNFRLVAVAGTLFLIITPLGSDNGIYNSIFSMWLVVPVLLHAFILGFRILMNKSFYFTQYGIYVPDLALGMQFIKEYSIIFLIAFSLLQTYLYTYRDSSNRFLMRYPVKSELLRGVYTTRERADMLNNILEQLKIYVNEDDYLFAFNNFPMINYLTNTRPYINNSWPQLYIHSQFKKVINNVHNEQEDMPVILISKVDTITSDWPKDHSSEYFEDLKNNPNLTLLYSFIETNNYTLVWKNIYFEIWKKLE